ncbi:MAG: hypothetical protein WBC93_04965 [Sulfitobacter sp.]
MIRPIVSLIMCFAVAACGGGPRKTSYSGPSTATIQFASGPISSACLRDNRKAATRARCGCVQAVANRTLSKSHQERGASLFSDPARLQEVRQSDNAANERFWKAWKNFGAQAAEVCVNT